MALVSLVAASELDLGALGAPRIEILYVILDPSRSATDTSEPEANRESAGIGLWRPLGGCRIGFGAESFRNGPDEETSICGAVGVASPPGNCVLKLGGVLRRQGGGSLQGDCTCRSKLPTARSRSSCLARSQSSWRD